eukprot:GHVN01000834.1.p1 GENE.GHVN01000834.1~~GHVN01000834.1.p1  ORF type:complete len:783 (+),score=149.29 GHVN01000834.1:139-2349(+)
MTVHLDNDKVISGPVPFLPLESGSPTRQLHHEVNVPQGAPMMSWQGQGILSPQDDGRAHAHVSAAERRDIFSPQMTGPVYLPLHRSQPPPSPSKLSAQTGPVGYVPVVEGHGGPQPDRGYGVWRAPSTNTSGVPVCPPEESHEIDGGVPQTMPPPQQHGPRHHPPGDSMEHIAVAGPQPIVPVLTPPDFSIGHESFDQTGKPASTGLGAVGGLLPGDPYHNGEGVVVHCPNLDEETWSYLDMEGKEQGLFTSDRMDHWCMRRCFANDVRMRYDKTFPFITLGHLFPVTQTGVKPFTYFPRIRMRPPVKPPVNLGAPELQPAQSPIPTKPSDADTSLAEQVAPSLLSSIDNIPDGRSCSPHRTEKSDGDTAVQNQSQQLDTSAIPVQANDVGENDQVDGNTGASTSRSAFEETESRCDMFHSVESDGETQQSADEIQAAGNLVHQSVKAQPVATSNASYRGVPLQPSTSRQKARDDEPDSPPTVQRSEPTTDKKDEKAKRLDQTPTDGIVLTGEPDGELVSPIAPPPVQQHTWENATADKKKEHSQAAIYSDVTNSNDGSHLGYDSGPLITPSAEKRVAAESKACVKDDGKTVVAERENDNIVSTDISVSDKDKDKMNEQPIANGGGWTTGNGGGRKGKGKRNKGIPLSLASTTEEKPVPPNPLPAVPARPTVSPVKEWGGDREGNSIKLIIRKGHTRSFMDRAGESIAWMEPTFNSITRKWVTKGESVEAEDIKVV